MGKTANTLDLNCMHNATKRKTQTACRALDLKRDTVRLELPQANFEGAMGWSQEHTLECGKTCDIVPL